MPETTSATTSLRFGEGLPGFPGLQRFTLSALTEDGAFQAMDAVDDPAVGLIVTSPWLCFPDYDPDLPEADCRALGIERPEQAVVLCTVNLDDGERLLLNLLAPIVISLETHEARQVVLDQDYPLRAQVPIVDEGASC